MLANELLKEVGLLPDNERLGRKTDKRVVMKRSYSVHRGVSLRLLQSSL